MLQLLIVWSRHRRLTSQVSNCKQDIGLGEHAHAMNEKVKGAH